MPQAKPKQPPPKPPTLVQSAGKQEDFHGPASDLALELGWVDDPDMIANDITFDDARNYIAKTMHEHFQAAAKGLPQPSYLDACKHLAVDNDEEQLAIDEALAAAYEAGKGAALQSHPATTGGMSANIAIGASAALGKFAEAGEKGKV